MRAAPSMMSSGGAKPKFAFAGRMRGRVFVGHPSGIDRVHVNPVFHEVGRAGPVIMLSAAFAMLVCGCLSVLVAR